MKKFLIGLTISLALAAGLDLTPTAALAFRGGFHGRSVSPGHVIVGGSPRAHAFGRHPFVSHPFVHRPFFRPFAPFVSFGIIGFPLVVYAPPPVYYDAPPAYYGSSTYYPPSTGGTMAVAPSPPPMPGVIQYPTGRYELRGDGVTTPYVWVWIPNPPPAPPPPPLSEPLTPPGWAPGEPPGAPQSHLYHWTDDEGAVHWTNSWEAVPEQYRPRTKRFRPA